MPNTCSLWCAATLNISNYNCILRNSGMVFISLKIYIGYSCCWNSTCILCIDTFLCVILLDIYLMLWFGYELSSKELMCWSLGLHLVNAITGSWMDHESSDWMDVIIYWHVHNLMASWGGTRNQDRGCLAVVHSKYRAFGKLYCPCSFLSLSASQQQWSEQLSSATYLIMLLSCHRHKGNVARWPRKGTSETVREN
jgi:hypothetical protein